MGKGKKSRMRLQISALEADIAYFDARLALLGGVPGSFYQEAQIKAYRELERVLQGRLQRMCGGPVQPDSDSGFEVSEVDSTALPSAAEEKS